MIAGLARRLFRLASRGALAAMLVMAAACVSAARPLDEVTQSGRIVIFVYADYPPWSWEKDGQMTGIDVEIAREIAKELGVELELMVRQGDENVDGDLRANIWRGDLVGRKVADVMMHVPFDRTLETRAESRAVLFAPYFGEEHAVVFDKAKLPEVTTFARFVYNPIAVENDSASDYFLSNAFRGQLLQSIRRGRLLTDAFAIFTSGEAPAYMGSLAQVEYAATLAKGMDTAIVQPPMQGIVRRTWPVGIAVKENSRDLGYAVSDALDKLRDSGKLAEIAARYGVTWKLPVIE